MRLFFYLLLSGLMMASCTSSRIISPDDSKEDQIIISSGGGFSGQWTTWYLLANGQCFKKDGIGGSINFTKKLTKDETKESFGLIQDLNLKERIFNHPGNMTYSLGWKHGGITYQVKWGEVNLDTPKEFESVYTRLLSIISPQNK